MSSHTLPGSPFVAYKNNELHIDNCNLASLAAQHQTPLFVYSKNAMLSALAAYQRGFAGRNALICYAMKANSSLAVLQLFAQNGCGFDIVSGGELARVLKAGADPKKVIFSGVGKTRAEMRQALEVGGGTGIACFNVESVQELDVLNEVALFAGKVAPISLRINPNVDPKTHPYISTGLKGSKFGIAHEEALASYRHASSLKGLRVVGIDCHIGSQILEVTPYLEAVDRMLDLVQSIELAGIPIQHIDFGGGLGINYKGQAQDMPPDADVLWQQLLVKIDARGFGEKQIMIEPGRSLVGNAGVCVTEVLYTKTANGEDGAKNFCIVDAAMNDLPRPAMYQAFHSIVPCKASPERTAGQSSKEVVFDVVGPVCESGDWLGRDRALDVQSGDLLAVLSAGAYCMAMASNYNSRGRAAEVLVDGDKAVLIRERESIDDQIRMERML